MSDDSSSWPSFNQHRARRTRENDANTLIDHAVQRVRELLESFPHDSRNVLGLGNASTIVARIIDDLSRQVEEGAVRITFSKEESAYGPNVLTLVGPQEGKQIRIAVVEGKDSRHINGDKPSVRLIIRYYVSDLDY